MKKRAKKPAAKTETPAMRAARIVADTTLTPHGQLDELEAVWIAEDKAFDRQLAAWGRAVRKQAGKDVFDMKLEDGTVLKVPRAPFENWALSRTSLRRHAPPWKCIAPSGTKMQCDNPYHTDWLLGAGFTTAKTLHRNLTHDPVTNAAYDLMFELQEKLGHFKAAVIVGGKQVDGVVGKEIAVLPNLQPDQLPKIIGAKAIITQAGGKLAHLALVALERSLPILRVTDAIERYPTGVRLHIYPDSGLVSESTDPKDAWGFKRAGAGE